MRCKQHRPPTEGLTGGEAAPIMRTKTSTPPVYTVFVGVHHARYSDFAPQGSRAERESGGKGSRKAAHYRCGSRKGRLPPTGEISEQGATGRESLKANQSYVGSITAGDASVFRGGTGACCLRLTTLLRESVETGAEHESLREVRVRA